MKTLNKKLKAMAVLLSVVTPLILALPVSADGDLNRKIQQLVHDLSSFKKGEVLKGSETQVYISLGEKHGVVVGSRFEIIRQGDPLKIGDEIIGYEEKKIALTKIDRVRNKMSIGTLTTREEIPRVGDKAYEQRKPIKRIVIAQFSDNQGFNRLTKMIQDKLITIATQRGLQVVERDKLETIMDELKLGYSGLLNTETAKKIGKMTGADAMLLGVISDMGNDISINARTVDMESGENMAAAETEFPNTPLIAKLRNMSVESKSNATRFTPANQVSRNRSGSSKGGVFVDDFKRGPDPAWERVSGDWTMANGRFTVATIQENQPYSVYLSGKKWKNLKLAVEVFSGRAYGWVDICPRAYGPRDRVCFRLGGGYGFQYSGWVVTTKGKEGQIIGKAQQSINENKTVEVVIELVGNVYTAYIDGMLVSEYFDQKYSEGGIALGKWYKDALSHRRSVPRTFDNVKVTPIK